MDNWKFVPVEPTEEMRAEICSGISHEHMVRNYKLMIAAAPQPPALGDDLDDALRDMASSACQMALDNGINDQLRKDTAVSLEAHRSISAERDRLQAEVERLSDELKRTAAVAFDGLNSRIALERLLRLANLAVEDMADIHSDNEDASSERHCRELSEKIDAALAEGAKS